MKTSPIISCVVTCLLLLVGMDARAGMKTKAVRIPPQPVGVPGQTNQMYANVPYSEPGHLIKRPSTPVYTVPEVIDVVNATITIPIGYVFMRRDETVKDTVMYEFPAKPAPDTLTLVIIGEGYAPPEIRDVRFGAVFLGDRETQKVYVPTEYANDEWIIGEHQDMGPFSIGDGKRVRVESDDKGPYVAVTFAPVVAGIQNRAIGLAHRRQGFEPADYILLIQGGGVSQTTGVELIFGSPAAPIYVGDTDVRSRLVRLGWADAPSRYALDINTPTTFDLNVVFGNGTSTLEIQGTFIPTSADIPFRREEVRLIHYADEDRTIPLDTLTVFAIGYARQAPVPEMHLLFPTRNVSVAIGDTVRLPVVAGITGVSGRPVPISKLVLDIAYNPSVLVPVVAGASPEISYHDGVAVVSVTLAEGSFPSGVIDGQVLDTLTFVAVMGNAISSPVTVEKISSTGAQVRYIPGDTCTVTLQNVWYYDGTPLLVNSRQGALKLAVQPNPVVTTAEVIVGGVPLGKGVLQLVTPDGRVEMDWTPQLRAGQTTFTLFAGSGAGSVTPGMYLVRLASVDANDQELSSVVRLVLVR